MFEHIPFELIAYLLQYFTDAKGTLINDYGSYYISVVYTGEVKIFYIYNYYKKKQKDCLILTFL